MNPISPDFARRLNESPWMGAIYEAGFGIPFQAHYLNIPGASKTILFTGSLYNKAFQPALKREDGKGFQRSVSNQMVEKMSAMFAGQAEMTIQMDIAGEIEGGAGFETTPPIFALTVSGAQSGPEYRGASHGWVNVGIIVEPGSYDRDPVVEHHSFHFFNQKVKNVRRGSMFDPDGSWSEEVPVTRKEAGDALCGFIEWFLDMVLLKRWDTWGEAIANKPYDSLISVDVIRSKNITIAEHLLLADGNTPLVYHGGEFKRPVDYFRKYNRVYRGSFNPITVTHDAIGQGSLFEISTNNVRKGRVSFEDIAERVEEVSEVGHPVLITSDRALFVELDELLTQRGMKNTGYILGLDTFNAVVDDKFCPTPDFLSQFYGYNSYFIVIPREGVELNDSERARKVKWELMVPDVDLSISSTRVRNGELDLVPECIRERVARRLLQ
jgi:hypothetical protein